MSERPTKIPGEMDQIVEQVRDLTGAAPPSVLATDAPVPAEAFDEAEVYYIGLIGGKDVGKTSLVNALAGVKVAEPSAFGEGTREVTAYCHRDAVGVVHKQLGEIKVEPHEVDSLRRQVLLDLPDIDSKYADHVALTRRMLRHMLFPIWVQSVEKYADARPQQLLKQVAEGNDPKNFLFVLSKCDQLIDREGLQAAGELAEDYAQRLTRALELGKPPEVMLVSSHRPGDYDLPRLRELVQTARSEQDVAASSRLAKRRQLQSVARWAKDQDLAGRAATAQRLLDSAGELLADRVGRPILEDALPAAQDDFARRMELTEPVVRNRMRAWPIVNLIDAAAYPMVLLVQKNISRAGPGGNAALQHLRDTGIDVTRALQSTFAQLHQSHPAISDLPDMPRLWEAPAAESSIAHLRADLDEAVRKQQRLLRDRLRPAGWLAPLRWLLTVGAVVWFLVAQPILETGFEMKDFDLMALAQRVVETISAKALLTNVTFVGVYLVLLWILLRLGTYARVRRWRTRQSSGSDAESEEASQAAVVTRWMQRQLQPLQKHHGALVDLHQRVERLTATGRV